MEFVPHICIKIILGPSTSESEKSMTILQWKGVSILIVRLLKNRESNGQEHEDDTIHASSLTKLSHDKRDLVWLYDRLHHIIDPHMNQAVIMSCQRPLTTYGLVQCQPTANFMWAYRVTHKNNPTRAIMSIFIESKICLRFNEYNV